MKKLNCPYLKTVYTENHTGSTKKSPRTSEFSKVTEDKINIKKKNTKKQSPVFLDISNKHMGKKIKYIIPLTITQRKNQIFWCI